MGCCPSKTQTKSISVIKEYQKRVHGRRTDAYEELFITKDEGDRLLARFSNSNSVTTKVIEHESFKQTPIDKNRTGAVQFNSTTTQKAVEEQASSEKNIETINTWELLAGLEDENEAGEVGKEESSKRWNATRHSTETREDWAAAEEAKLMETTKGREMDTTSRSKVTAKEITGLTEPPAFELSRTGSLKDWLSPGRPVFSPESYMTPKFGTFEEDMFDPRLVARFEQAMEDLTMEEEEVLRLIL